MSGSGGDGGYDFQADAFAFVAAFVLAEHHLGWFDSISDQPLAISMESGGPGDDLRVELFDGRVMEVQAKHGLSRGPKFDDAVLRICSGLANNEDMLGVLLVDGTSSGTIRNDLRQDLLRLAGGRSDGLKEITRHIRELVSSKGIDDAALARLRVIVKDLEVGHDGRAAAIATLGAVVASTRDAGTAFEILGKEGHHLTKRRGRRDARSLSGFVSRHVPLSPACANGVVVATAYCRWLESATETFLVPGTNIALPSSLAWNQLELRDTDTVSEQRRLEDELRHYVEWVRLGDSLGFRSSSDAEDVLVTHRRLVVIGGAGSGKSTLVRRLSHWLAHLDRVVVRVRLAPLVAQLAKGATFEEALLRNTTDGMGISPEQASRFLSNPDYLLADGLDECGSQRLAIAERINRWALGRPHCRVLITTRPVGYVPALFPGFEHAEIIPLTNRGVDELASALLERLLPERDRREELRRKLLRDWDDLRR